MASMGDLLCLFHRSTAVRAGVNRKRHRDCVHMRPEYFDGMQMHEDFAVVAAVRWDNLWSSTRVCPERHQSSMYVAAPILEKPIFFFNLRIFIKE